jgi:hypothetical protein
MREKTPNCAAANMEKSFRKDAAEVGKVLQFDVRYALLACGRLSKKSSSLENDKLKHIGHYHLSGSACVCAVCYRRFEELFR